MILLDQPRPVLSDNVEFQGHNPCKKTSHNKKHSFEALRAAFLHSLQAQDYSPSTVASYGQDLAKFGKWLEKQNLTVLELSGEDLQRYKTFAYKENQKRPTTVNRYLATIRRFYRWTQRIGYLPALPDMPKFLAQPVSCIRWLSASQQRRLLCAAKQHTRDHAIIALLIHAGLRASELCGLQWQDIHMTERNGSVHVRQAKGKRERTLPLNAPARTAVYQLGYEHHVGKKEPLLQGRKGPLTTRSLQRIVGKYGRRADIHRLSPHSLRHTFCKNLVNARISLETVAKLAGHAHLETTKRYCEPAWQDLERAVAAVAK